MVYAPCCPCKLKLPRPSVRTAHLLLLLCLVALFCSHHSQRYRRFTFYNLVPISQLRGINPVSDRGSVSHHCPPPPTEVELRELVMHGLRAAALVPTPAFNLHDHYMLAGALVSALRAVKDPNASSVEVGAFAGHTAVFTAALLDRLGAQGAAAKLHVVESDEGYGIRHHLSASQFSNHVELHHNFSRDLRDWRQPLRYFLEDSAHTYDVTKESFDVFEPC